MHSQKAQTSQRASHSSDELGDLGEAIFKKMCSEARLIANQATRDRGGWDFVVQFPSHRDSDTLDGREGLTTAYVQVKAVWADRRPRFRLKLSAAELLAKQIAPSFLVGISISRDDVEKFDIYLIEMAGSALERILKSLRTHQRSGRRAINDTVIYFNADSDCRLQEPINSALLAKLRSAVDEGPERYAVEKARQLRTAGSTTVSATLSIEGMDESSLIDVFLGVRPCDVTVSDVRETRFGIPLPSDRLPTGKARLRVQPNPVSTYQLTVASPGLTNRLRFSGRLSKAALPHANGIVWKTRFDAGTFVVEIDANQTKLTATLGDLDDQKAGLSSWLDAHDLMLTIGEHESRYELKKAGRAEFSWTFPRQPNFLPFDISSRIDVLHSLQKIFKHSGYNPNPLSQREIFSCRRSILTACVFGIDFDRDAKMTIPSESDKVGEMSIIFAGIFDIDDSRFAFASQLTMHRAHRSDEWETVAKAPIDVQWIDTTEDAFRCFVEEMKSISGIDDLLLDNLETEFFRKALGEISEF